MKEIMFILYITDQVKSRDFYKSVLKLEPSLDVPGMTEFKLENNVLLGLMPNDGIAKIIGKTLPHPSKGSDIPRCELYLKLGDAKSYIDRAIKSGARLVSPMQKRSWGDTAGYVADPDGHLIAFAEKI